MINCKNSAKLILGTLCAMALAIPTLSSCEHKDLCFDHDVHAPKFDFRVTASRNGNLTKIRRYGLRKLNGPKNTVWHTTTSDRRFLPDSVCTYSARRESAT